MVMLLPHRVSLLEQHVRSAYGRSSLRVSAAIPEYETVPGRDRPSTEVMSAVRHAASNFCRTVLGEELLYTRCE